MILTSLDEVRPGMALGAGVHNPEGQTLLGPDVPLTAAYIERLDALGCSAVWIDDEDTRDIPFDHLLSEETRLRAAAHVQRIFALATREGPALASVALHDVQPLLRRFQRGDQGRSGDRAPPRGGGRNRPGGDEPPGAAGRRHAPEP